ncbi:endopeptidase La [Lacinutrix sp. 5H-3-7-4]|uniref:endopeptidase La n=1 Tax=Lacinutrix sp. (strain 5H-3-7-4) TaxID=983544 RepID=UPI00020A3E7C|nr:endopeptidase La [Lacinutrix sp. 5H-3-7-4]AEH02512.1 anti-sigma H sporulation factor, LonB [Lacinutrix sp. 5H-3-7-4]
MKKSNFISLDSLSLQDFDANSELIPLMTPEDEEKINNESLPETLPILSLRNTVLFPGVVIPITAGRDKSIKLINDANNGGKVIGVVSQKDEAVEDPKAGDIHEIGTVARILKVLKMPDGNTTVIIQGKKRFSVAEVITEEPYINATVREVPEAKPAKKNKEFQAIIDSIKELALQIIKDSPNIPSEASFAIQNIESDSFLINFVSSNMNLPVKDKQALLEKNDLKDRALETLKFMNIELQKLELKNDIQSKVQSDMNQQQREYFLNQQMKTIQEELGGGNAEEMEDMKKRAKAKKWDDKVAEHFEKELSKMQRMNPQVAEYSIQRNYLDLFLDLPWNEFSKDKFDLKRAKKILDRDHYGLDDVKKRIIEYLAVLKLRNDMKSPILCLYGPPGVGKTSLGKSIAEALGREYVRMSLGGLRDEAEIRGHRKTYIGAMPGRIIQSLKKAGTSNPVFVLDEIDKLSNSHQGDPSSALLEVLDPEQNSEFHDNFLEMGYDLSKVMFIATSNSLANLQPALRDRMEIINVTGYTIEEKVEIGKRHLLPKQLKEHGLEDKHLKLGKPQLEKIVEGYTRESGVRTLDKKIAKMVRYAAMNIAMEEEYDVKVTNDTVVDVLGGPKLERDKYENNDVAGVVTGLAWTRVGGDILFIESILSKGKGSLSITGNIGKVMKESATIAMEYIKANADEFGINPEVFDKYNVHIHVPEGATPKDGPSAGVTMLTSLVSLFTQKKVKKSIAMTGEITLRGKVLPVGGIKEKILAAKRAKIKEILLCEENKRDIEEIKPEYVKGLKFHFVTDMKDVLKLALTNQKVKNAKKL